MNVEQVNWLVQRQHVVAKRESFSTSATIVDKTTRNEQHVARNKAAKTVDLLKK